MKTALSLTLVALLVGASYGQTLQYADNASLATATSLGEMVIFLYSPTDPYSTRLEEEMNEKKGYVAAMNRSVTVHKIAAQEPITVMGKPYPTGFAFANTIAQAIGSKLKPVTPMLITVMDPLENSSFLYGYGEAMEYLKTEVFPKTDPDRATVATPAPAVDRLKEDRERAYKFIREYSTSPENDMDRWIFDLYREQNMTVVGTGLYDLSSGAKEYIANLKYYESASYMIIIVSIKDEYSLPRLDLWNPDREFHYLQSYGERVTYGGAKMGFYEYHPGTTHFAETYIDGYRGAQYRLYIGMKVN